MEESVLLGIWWNGRGRNRREFTTLRWYSHVQRRTQKIDRRRSYPLYRRLRDVLWRVHGCRW
jgi:hypothetical protein